MPVDPSNLLDHALRVVVAAIFAFGVRAAVVRVAREPFGAKAAYVLAYLCLPVILVVGLVLTPVINPVLFPHPTDSLQSNGVYLTSHAPWGAPLVIAAPLVLLADTCRSLLRRRDAERRR